MPNFTTEQLSNWAKQRPRDANGHFLKRGTNPIDTAKTTITTSTPPVKPTDPLIEQPFISLTIHNPFKRLLYWLNDIRKKQTTTVDFKIQIPLIALPVFLLVLGSAFSAFFSLGKASGQKEVLSLPTPTPVVITQAPQPVLISRIGIIKATYHVLPSIVPTKTDTESSPSATPPEAGPTSTPSRFVLITGNTQITFLTSPLPIAFSNYLNQRVLVTGFFDKTTNTLRVNKSSDIEVLP